MLAPSIKGALFPNSFLNFLTFSHLHCWLWRKLAPSHSLQWFLLEFEGKEKGDLEPHLHQSNPSLSEGNPLDLDLGVPFVEFFFVLTLLFPHKHLLLCWNLRVKDLSTSYVLALHLLHSFELSTLIRSSESPWACYSWRVFLLDSLVVVTVVAL